MDTPYDILILGTGPIGTSTAYHLSKNGTKKIAMIGAEPQNNDFATYQNAGGCVRWYWDDPKKIADTKETADFIKELAATGVDVSLHEDTYLFLNWGKHVPAINVSSAKLLSHLQEEAKGNGVVIHQSELITDVQEVDGLVTVTTDKNTYQAHKVLLALGAKNPDFMKGYEIEEEERYLLVLDVPVGEHEMTFPHTIAAIGDGFTFLFIKKLPEGWRFVLGEEDVLGTPKTSNLNEHLHSLLETGLGDIMPFLKEAKVERLLLGMDVEHKSLLIKEQRQIIAASCGSAVRSCIPIGKQLATILEKN